MASGTAHLHRAGRGGCGRLDDDDGRLSSEVSSTEQVTAATDRLKGAGLATLEENDTSCCYALQDKVWVHAPGKEPWEVYVVKGDADQMGRSAALDAAGACCPSQPAAAEVPEAATGCACGA